MDSQVSGSFIPKKPLDGSMVTSHNAFGGLFMLLSVFVFIASIVAAGAAFAYHGYLTSSIASKALSLQRAQAAFDPSVIQDLVRLDSRINNAERLMQKHVAPSALFSFLSLETLQNVSFTAFSYQLGDDGSASISLSGIAQDFAAVALQSDQFSASHVLKDVIFSDINVDQQGHVTFSVAATVDPLFINYGKNLGGSAAASTTPAAPTAPAATSTAQ